MRLHLLVPLLTIALPAWAETPISGDQFDAYSRGKTMTYAEAGQVYGTEQYLPDHKVLWAFSGDECRKGTWYEQNGTICFVYEDNPDAQCWQFFLDTSGLRARFMGDPDGSELSVVQESQGPLSCAGPDLGV